MPPPRDFHPAYLGLGLLLIGGLMALGDPRGLSLLPFWLLALGLLLVWLLASWKKSATRPHDPRLEAWMQRSVAKIRGVVAQAPSKSRARVAQGNGPACTVCGAAATNLNMRILDFGVKQDTFFVCALCGAGAIHSHREEYWRDADDDSYEGWEISLLFTLDAPHAARLTAACQGCPDPFLAECGCETHRALRASRESLRGNSTKAVRIIVEKVDGQPVLRNWPDHPVDKEPAGTP